MKITGQVMVTEVEQPDGTRQLQVVAPTVKRHSELVRLLAEATKVAAQGVADNLEQARVQLYEPGETPA